MDFEKIYRYSGELNVLYAEDDAFIQEETVDLLDYFFADIAVASNGAEALELYKKEPSKYDLVITDINMPVMDGMELIKQIHAINPEEVIIVVSAHNEGSRLVELIHLGINNFVMKPMQHEQLFSILYSACKAIYNQKELLKYKVSLEDDNKSLVAELSEKNKELLLTQKVSIEAIAAMVESYDDETGAHVRRIQSYVYTIVQALSAYKEELQAISEDIALSSVLHDIGKLMVPKAILTKPEKLSYEEFEIIKQHAQLGGEVLASANEIFKQNFDKDSFLKTAADIAMYHHEKWDGSGYPKGLEATQIPLSARIVAIADVYDAIRSKRVYKEQMSHETACEIIEQESAKAFDPEIVKTFLKVHETFAEIFEKLQ